jgi:hypothetical protein
MSRVGMSRAGMSRAVRSKASGGRAGMSRVVRSRASSWANKWVSLVWSGERLRQVWVRQVGVPLTAPQQDKFN